MEEWQKSHIQKHLVELIENTTCNVQLLSKLQQTGVLCQSDYEDIQYMRTPLEKARRLYEILATRQNGFEFLLNALTEVKQTGALAILQLDMVQVNSNENILPVYKDINENCLADLEKLLQKEKHQAKANSAKNQLIDIIAQRIDISDEHLKSVRIDINAVNKYEETFLHLAARREQVDGLALLISFGAQWNCKTVAGESVLHFAAAGGNIKAIRYFKSLGVDINLQTTNSGITPLHQAIYAGTRFVETVRTLVDLGANVNATNCYGQNLMLLATRKGKSIEELTEVARLGGDWKLEDVFENSAYREI